MSIFKYLIGAIDSNEEVSHGLSLYLKSCLSVVLAINLLWDNSFGSFRKKKITLLLGCRLFHPVYIMNHQQWVGTVCCCHNCLNMPDSGGNKFIVRRNLKRQLFPFEVPLWSFCKTLLSLAMEVSAVTMCETRNSNQKPCFKQTQLHENTLEHL